MLYHKGLAAMLPESQATEADTAVDAEQVLPSIDPAKAQALFAQLLQQQNFPLGVLGGLVAAIVGGLTWAAVTIATGYQIGWMAVGIGFLVGVVVRKLGKGLTKKFGVAGGALALFGCLLGNFLAMCGLVATDAGEAIVPITLAFVTHPTLALELMKETFSPMDVLFYGIAVYEGYKFSFREVSDADLSQMVA